MLHAPLDKIHPMPFPGLNIDNLPFFAVIAAVAEGQTLLHDWVYENRAIYLVELNKLGGEVKLLDPHRVMIEGPTHWSGAEVVCPPALRPAVVILLAMLASKGTSRAAVDVRHPPRVRGPRRAPQPARRQHRAVPRHLAERLGLGGTASAQRAASRRVEEERDARRPLEALRRGSLNRVSTQARAGILEVRGAAMSSVIRGMGMVPWLARRCQSVSDSTREPRSMRARKTPWPSGQDHRCPEPSGRAFISVPHWGQTLTWDWSSAWASSLMCTTVLPAILHL